MTARLNVTTEVLLQERRSLGLGREQERLAGRMSLADRWGFGDGRIRNGTGSARLSLPTTQTASKPFLHRGIASKSAMRARECNAIHD
jgi:hypothetical protein